MKKMLALLLGFVFVLTACNAGEEASSAVSGDASDVSYGEVDFKDRANVKDSLPEKADYGGKTFTVLQRTEYNYEFGVEEIGVTNVQDLIFERDAVVEERFNVKIVSRNVNGAWGMHENFLDHVRDTIATGKVDYDVIAGYAAVTPTLVGDGIFVDWTTVPNIDLEREWWSQDLISELTVNDKLYLISGDISLLFWESMQGMFFNKTMAENAGVEDLYELARNGEWTFDKMMEIIRSTHVANDDLTTRVYGYSSARTTQVDVYQDAFNIAVTEKDGTGRPQFTLNQEKTYNALQKVYDLICVSDYYYQAESYDDSLKMFGENRALFFPGRLGSGAQLNGYECNYGILPMPKYDEFQEDYHSTCEDGYSMMAIPVTNEDNLEFIGLVTEALCAQSYRSVVPQWYTVILQNRYTKDEDSIEMIETIREGILCNFGYIYSYAMDWPAHQFNICINNNSPDFASLWEQKENTFAENLDRVLEPYYKN